MTIDTDNDQYSLALECPDKFSYSADIKVPDVLAVQPDFKARGKKVRRGLDRVVCNYLRYILWLSPGGWNAHIFKKKQNSSRFCFIDGAWCASPAKVLRTV